MKSLVAATVLLVLAATGFAQQSAAAAPSPTPPPAAPEMVDLRFLRMKIAAGDLYSAESILETHRADKGEDAEYILGLAWLARGAALTGDWQAASRYAKASREIAVSRLGTAPVYDNNREALYALGTAIEVDAQALVAAGRKAQALRLLQDSAVAQAKAPYNLRARLWKRRNQMSVLKRLFTEALSWGAFVEGCMRSPEIVAVEVTREAIGPLDRGCVGSFVGPFA